MLLSPTSSSLSFLILFQSTLLIVEAASCSTQLGSTKTSSVPTYTTAFTVTTTLTEYLTTITKTKTKGTTTIPTSPGFTPILSETSNAAAANAAAVSPAANVAKSSFPATVFCTTTTTRTVTKSITDSHKVAATTLTVTSTATVPAATTYAACGSDNIIDQGIGPPGAGHAIEIISEGNGTYTRILYNNVTSAYDCCVMCQTTPLCAWGYLQVGFGTSTPLPEPLCVLETDSFGGCNGAVDFGDAYFRVNLNDYPQLGPGQGAIMFNGPCGQIAYAGAYTGS